MVEGVAASTRTEATGDGQTKSTPEAKLKQACQDFEGIFLGLVAKQMRATVPHDGILPEMLERSLAGTSSAEDAAAASQALGDTKGVSTLVAAVRAGVGSSLLSAGEGAQSASPLLSNLPSRKSLPAVLHQGRPAGLLFAPSEEGATKTGTTGSDKPLSSTKTADAILGEIGTSPR